MLCVFYIKKPGFSASLLEIVAVWQSQLPLPQVIQNGVIAVSLDEARVLQFAVVPHQALLSYLQSSSFVCITYLPPVGL